MTHIAKPIPLHCLPLTDATVVEFYEYVYAPWVKMLGLREFKVSPGMVSALLPQNDALKFSSGAVCGQAIMAAIDSVHHWLSARRSASLKAPSINTLTSCVLPSTMTFM